MKLLSSILLTLLLLALPAAAEASIKAALDSSFLVKGEQTRITVYLQSDERPTTRPTPPTADHLTIQFQGENVRRLQTRQLVYLYTYLIRSFQEGTHVVPPFTMESGGQLIQTVPLELRVAPLEELTWNTQTELGQTFRYATAVFVPEASPYDGQTFPAEVKVYLPDHTGGASSGLAELDHDGLVAWRFEAVPATTNVQLPTGGHFGITFQSTASPIRSGAVSLGPGKARIMMRVQRSERGFTIVQDMPGEFTVPQRTLQARPLPPGAPAGFAGAVGTFQLNATAEIDELEDGDPIAVRLNVIGSGNLDSLPAPRLDAPESDWKVYEASRLERQGERRDVTGAVSFSQIIRPLNLQDQVPPFELTYFNPQTATYATSRTNPIPFKTKPSPRAKGNAAIIPTLATPLEDMQGILSVIDPRRSQPPAHGPSWLRFWQVLPALLALALLAHIARLRIFPRLKTSEREQQIKSSLAEVAAAGDNEGLFLRSAGAFVERWIPMEDREGELAALLERRDTDCFRPDHAERNIPHQEKQSLLKLLRDRALASTSVLLLLATLLLATPAPASADNETASSLDTAESAYLEGNYRTALELYSGAPQPHSADLLYNIGNCHYQLEAPGLAALFYHRALLQDPEHPEALQNLRFIERSQGSITFLRKPYETNLAKLQPTTYRTFTTLGLWISTLALLSFFAPGIGKLLASLSLAAGLLLTSAGAVCQYYYPDDAEFADPSERAVMTNTERLQGRAEASESGPKVIEVPPGSLCRILAPRGTWTYLEFPNHTRAWVPSSEVSPLIPTSPATNDRL